MTNRSRRSAMENSDVFGSSTAPLTWHDFLERMRHPSAAGFVKSIKRFPRNSCKRLTCTRRGEKSLLVIASIASKEIIQGLMSFSHFSFMPPKS
ncbi:hypothetical protein AAHA92_33545 [Salvia divinorum]|uniref:Uncharacterized protein n=1 Tax=Salvia divinorum TaxID=28513 RepID=A0ABD1FRR3_SALDI